MASASIRFFMKDADAVKDADADQCKRTCISNKVYRLAVPLSYFESKLSVEVVFVASDQKYDFFTKSTIFDKSTPNTLL